MKRCFTFLLSISLLALTVLNMYGCSSVINEEQWKYAFSDECMQNCEIVKTNGSDLLNQQICKRNGGITFLINKNKGETTEALYYTDESNTVWQYKYDEMTEKWYKTKYTYGPLTYIDYLNLDRMFGNLYDLFKYDSESKCYKRITDSLIYHVYFEGDKVKKIQIIQYYLSVSETYTLEFYNYGKVNITLPNAVTID